MLFRRICGVDLGNDTIKICDRNEKQYICEKNLIAIRDEKQIIAIGHKAYEIYEKAPAAVAVTSPMKEGAIADVKNLEFLLRRLVKRYASVTTRQIDLIITAPMEASELEKIAYHQLLTGNIKAKRVALIESGLADAIGIGMPVLHQMGNMVVNIGAATTEISVVADRKIIIGRRFGSGGNKLDEDIAVMVKNEYGLNIGLKSAELLKNNIGYVNEPKLQKCRVFGIHAVTGLPVAEEVSPEHVHAAMMDTIRTIVDAVRVTLERTPPQLVADIQKNGIYLTGGVSQLPGLAEYISKCLEIPAYQAAEPISSTVRGLVQVINSPELRKLTFPIKDFTGITL